ncbi:MAG: glycosyltransferase [Pseudomonadota bacterium]
MTDLHVSASLVLYKPDLPTVERTLLALQLAGERAKAHYGLMLTMTLVDNSADSRIHVQLERWLQEFATRMPLWNVQLMRSPGNIGYGQGNNLVIKDATSQYHIVVNPDLFVAEDALLEALRFMEARPDAGLLTPAVFDEDGERQYLCKRDPTLLVMFLRSFSPKWLKKRLQSVADHFEMRDWDYEQVIPSVEYPTGCFMFFRTRTLQQIGGFDPDFFLHYEDADVGRRMRSIAPVVYVPAVKVVHQWARNTHHSFKPMFVTVRSGWLYVRKWGGYW